MRSEQSESGKPLGQRSKRVALWAVALLLATLLAAMASSFSFSADALNERSDSDEEQALQLLRKVKALDSEVAALSDDPQRTELERATLIVVATLEYARLQKSKLLDDEEDSIRHITQDLSQQIRKKGTRRSKYGQSLDRSARYLDPLSDEFQNEDDTE